MTTPDSHTPSASQARQVILVVEDSPDDVELLADMFRRSRILNPVQAVTSVRDAVCYLKGDGIYKDRQRYPFPLLLLVDLHLNDGSGFDVLQWCEENHTQCPVAIVVLTGSDLGAVQRAYAKGAHSFLTKPLKFADFANMVRNVRGIRLVSTGHGHLLERH